MRKLTNQQHQIIDMLWQGLSIKRYRSESFY